MKFTAMATPSQCRAWKVREHLFVTVPRTDTAGYTAAVYRAHGRRLRRVVLFGGSPFQARARDARTAALKLMYRIEAYLGARAEPVSIDLRPYTSEGSWVLADDDGWPSRPAAAAEQVPVRAEGS